MNKLPVLVDGAAYVLIALFGALSASMGSDEAAKWLEPATLFWARTGCTSALAMLVAVKTFLSTTYANYLNKSNFSSSSSTASASTAST